MNAVLRKIEDRDLEQIMQWRMSPDITRYMNTDPVLTLEGQRKWIQAVQKDDSMLYWLLEVNDLPAGVVCLVDIDLEAKSASWGYYVGEKQCRSLELALSLEMSLYDFVFDELGLQCLRSEVFALNRGVVKLHKLCGSRVVRVGKEEVCKNGVFYDIVHTSIEKEEWFSLRTQRKYEKIHFPPTK